MLYQALNDPPNFTFTFVSKGSKVLIGYTPEELVKGDIKLFNIVHPDDALILEPLHRSTLSVGLPLETTFRITTKSGKEKRIWMRSFVVDTNDEGMPCLIEGFFMDLTKQIHIETSKLANRAKIDFLTKMSHEIRTPMNTIIGMAEIGLREDMPDNIREYTYSIKKAGGKLMYVLNDILDYTNIKNDDPELFMDEYTLSSLITDVIDITKEQMVEIGAGLDFLVYANSKIPNILIGDVVKLRQIILNLLSNAVKFTDEGFISLSIDGEVDSNALDLIITVEDTGRGVKEEDFKNLYKEFAQFDDKMIEGTGLGLFITHNFVNLMGGKIEFSSMYGVGSIFTVTLSQNIRVYERLCEINNPDQKKVLIFEHREIHLNSITHAMDGFGVHYDIVETISELYTALESEYSHVFITNEMHNEFKKTYPNFQANTKFILITDPFFCLTIANILNDVDSESNQPHHTTNNENYAVIVIPQVRVLIVDDIKANLVVAKGLLKPYEMDIDLCESGAEAIEAVKSNRYDLIFMDHMMPVMNGVEAVACIRALEVKCQTDCKNVPIVALTANAAHGTWEMFYRNGFNDFLPKPIDTVKLNAIIEKWISREKQNNDVVIIDKPNFKINGIDVQRGIFLSGGRLDIYLQVVEVYYKDGLKLLGELKECIEKENIELYKIHVHALKGASATIGAVNFSKFAATLEHAAEQDDVSFIRTETPRFLIELEMLLDNISQVIIKDVDNKNTCTDELKLELELLKKAISDSDISTINECTKKLQKYLLNEDVGDIINKILINKMTGKYDIAVALINTILEA